MTVKIDQFLVTVDNSIREVMGCINCNTKGVALVVEEGQRLIGMVTDGDIRRSILSGLNLDAPISELIALKAASPYSRPVTAPAGIDRSALLHLMRESGVHQVPLVDDKGSIADLVTMNDLLPDEILPVQALIMAGGYGSRLHPLTENLPKPMLPVGDRPLMELTIKQLHQAGIRRVNISTHYQSEKITDYFGNGNGFGVDINYVTENRPLGTAGALGLMEVSNDPLLVINGDILTQVDFRAMLSYHRHYGADITVAVRHYDLQVPYGVIECEGVYVRGMREKPAYSFFINAGIYLLQPSVHRYIPNGQSMDMTDLIKGVIQEGRSVISFPVVEYWLDIGQLADYKQAQEDIKHVGLLL